MKVELIYFEGCPNVEPARRNLKKAFDSAGITEKWIEWDQKDKAAPDYVRKYGSPTILVNGTDIMGGPGDCCAPDSCRIYEGGAPSAEKIRAVLEKRYCP